MSLKKERHLSKRRRRVLAFAKQTWQRSAKSQQDVAEEWDQRWMRTYDDPFPYFKFVKCRNDDMLHLHIYPGFEFVSMLSCLRGEWKRLDLTDAQQQRRDRARGQNVTEDLVNEIFS